MEEGQRDQTKRQMNNIFKEKENKEGQKRVKMKPNGREQDQTRDLKKKENGIGHMTWPNEN
jgi:hypothetical protein